MKRMLLILGLVLIPLLLQAQTLEQYSFKLQGIYGTILPHDKYTKALVQDPVKGAELSVEFQTMNEKSWYQFNGFPKIGIGAVWLNLGNPAKLGDGFALYPYLCFPVINTDFLKLFVKGGAGMSYLTKTYYNTNTDSLGNLLPSLTGTNAAVGSNLNVYFSGGLNLEIPISQGVSLTADYTWNHISNGSAVAPNSGLNMLNGFVGIRYFPNFKSFHAPEKKELTDIPRKFSVEMIASGGFRQLYYKDNKTFPIASFIVGVYRPITNFYRMGIALDAFYDGVYDGHEILFKRVYLKTNEFKNKVRIGTSWQHEIMLGRVIAGFDFGLYLYDPLKNLSPVTSTGELKNPGQNKPLIYPYKIDVNGNESGEDGWFYSRASIKYLIDKHLFISVGLKTHLQKAEFIEWGLGYRL